MSPQVATGLPVSENQLGYWLRRGALPLCLCTDDQGVFCTSASRELELARLAFALDRRALLAFVAASFEHAFDSSVRAPHSEHRSYAQWFARRALGAIDVDLDQ